MRSGKLTLKTAAYAHEGHHDWYEDVGADNLVVTQVSG